MDLNNKNIEEIKSWVKEFHTIYKYNSSFYTKTDKQEILGNKDERKCRFCGKTKQETTFKKSAHVIPAFMGNTFVKSYYECDDCNLKFASYENDLAYFIGLRRFYVSSSKNHKRKVFKLPNSNAELYNSIRGMEVIDPKNEIFETLGDGETSKCKINKSPFVPLNVYKALVKIVLSLLNDQGVKQFQKTLRFLISDELDCNEVVKKFAKLSCHEIGDCNFDYPIVFTYNKLEGIDIEEDKNRVVFPDKTFIIYFNQFCFQIFLPFDLKDKKIYEDYRILFKCFPPILTEPKDISITTLYKDYYHTFRDLSSNIKVCGEKDEFYIRTIYGPFKKEYTDEEQKILTKKFDLREIKK